MSEDYGPGVYSARLQHLPHCHEVCLAPCPVLALLEALETTAHLYHMEAHPVATLPYETCTAHRCRANRAAIDKARSSSLNKSNQQREHR